MNGDEEILIRAKPNLAGQIVQSAGEKVRQAVSTIGGLAEGITLDDVGKLLMIIGALGPAGSAQSRAQAMQSALTALQMQQQERAERARLEEQRRQFQEKIRLTEEELALERERLNRLYSSMELLMMKYLGDDTQQDIPDVTSKLRAWKEKYGLADANLQDAISRALERALQEPLDEGGSANE